MAFLPELGSFLKSNGRIYTVRGYLLPDGPVYVNGVGSCERKRLRRVSVPEDLTDFVGESGFGTVEAWWCKIREFVPDVARLMYLYEVVYDETKRVQ